MSSSAAATHSGAELLLPPGAGFAAATLAVSLPLALLLWLSGAVELPRALAAMMLFGFVVLAAGSLALRAVDAADMPVAAAWVAGIFTTALAVYALVQWFQMLAAAAFAVWAVVVLGLSVGLRQPAALRRRMTLKEMLGLLLCGVATLMWCRQIAEAPVVLATERMLTAWIDYYIHAGIISHFGDPIAQDRLSMELADFPKPFYHYASYVLPAVFAAPLDLPGLPLATSAWLPFGFLTMCAGAYALGAALGGPAGGIAAVGVLTMVPDPSNYGLRHGFFSFHWNVLALPGAPYAIGLSLLAIAFLQRWTQSRRLPPLIAGAGLVGGVLLFRAHIFGLLLPAFAASVAVLFPVVQRRKLLFFGLAASGFVFFVLGLYASLDLVPALELFLDAMHSQKPIAYFGWYPALLESAGRGIAVPTGMLLVVAASLGAFVILYPLTALLARRAGTLRAIDVVPGVLIVCYFLVMLAAPVPSHGDPSELTHRPFVLLYAVVAVYTAVTCVNWLTTKGAARHLWQSLALASVLGIVLVWPQTGVLGELPKFYWAWRHYPSPVKAGMLPAADFLRRNARPGDLIATGDLDHRWVSADAATQLSAMTGIPAYLARPFIHLWAGGPRRELAIRRYVALHNVAAAQSPAAAALRLRELGVAWYVVIGDRGPSWDRERLQCAFCEGIVAVYSSRQL